MQTEKNSLNNSPQKEPVIFYGKKVYILNPLIARKEPIKKEPEYRYEDIEEDKNEH